jgi:hypothetical protein
MSPFTTYICHFWILLKFEREIFNFVTDTGHSVSQFLPSTTAIKDRKMLEIRTLTDMLLSKLIVY